MRPIIVDLNNLIALGWLPHITCFCDVMMGGGGSQGTDKLRTDNEPPSTSKRFGTKAVFKRTESSPGPIRDIYSANRVATEETCLMTSTQSYEDMKDGIIAIDEDVFADGEDSEGGKNDRGGLLLICFGLLVLIGLGNTVFGKLQTYPMYNYPFFNNLLSTFIYVPICFAYIIPIIFLSPDTITAEQRAIPKYKFAVMGALDSCSSIMNTLATTYITNAPMIVLLTQASIPISMLISKVLLGSFFTRWQYMGAAVVLAGLAVVLSPEFSGQQSEGPGQLMWAGVMVLSTVPDCFSNVYKEKALGEVDINIVFINGWVALFQLCFLVPLLIITAPSTGLELADVPANLLDGAKCLAGVDTYQSDSRHHPADKCGMAPYYVSAYIFFNLSYNLLIIALLKFGSAALLYIALTMMVPLANFAFALPFIPNRHAFSSSDVTGLVLIMVGLFIYRFLRPVLAATLRHKKRLSRRKRQKASQARRTGGVLGAGEGEGESGGGVEEEEGRDWSWLLGPGQAEDDDENDDDFTGETDVTGSGADNEEMGLQLLPDSLYQGDCGTPTPVSSAGHPPRHQSRYPPSRHQGGGRPQGQGQTRGPGHHDRTRASTHQLMVSPAPLRSLLLTTLQASSTGGAVGAEASFALVGPLLHRARRAHEARHRRLRERTRAARLRAEEAVVRTPLQIRSDYLRRLRRGFGCSSDPAHRHVHGQRHGHGHGGGGHGHGHGGGGGRGGRFIPIGDRGRRASEGGVPVVVVGSADNAVGGAVDLEVEWRRRTGSSAGSSTTTTKEGGEGGGGGDRGEKK